MQKLPCKSFAQNAKSIECFLEAEGVPAQTLFKIVSLEMFGAKHQGFLIVSGIKKQKGITINQQIMFKGIFVLQNEIVEDIAKNGTPIILEKTNQDNFKLLINNDKLLFEGYAVSMLRSNELNDLI